MSIVVGTAGHIDHGKTSLLRALTGIDADRLPEEQRRGMTIDVGYAHLVLPDGDALDFVDVPGHDGLVENMLVGAGEVDAVLLVVAADDGPRAQTIEHLQLLDAYGIRPGIAVVTKADVVEAERVGEVVAAVGGHLAQTSLAGSPVLAVSSRTGAGLDELRAALVRLRDLARARALTRPPGPLRLPIDRVFAVKGRGAVVTGSLRGGRLDRATSLRLEPGGLPVRVREIQVRGRETEEVDGGRTALNVAGVEAAALTRGAVLTSASGMEVTDRMLVLLRPVAARVGARVGAGAGAGVGAAAGVGTGLGLRAGPRAAQPRTAEPLADGARLRLHVGTAAVTATLGLRGREGSELQDGSITGIVRLDRPVATFVGDRFILRRPSPGLPVAGGVVLDPLPPRGVSRRRVTPERLASLADAVERADPDAASDVLVGLHGLLDPRRIAATVAALRPPDTAAAGLRAPGTAGAGAVAAIRPDLPIRPDTPTSAATPPGEFVLAPDIADRLGAAALDAVRAHHLAAPLAPGLTMAALRPVLLATLRSGASIRSAAPGLATRAGSTSAAPAAGTAAVDRVVADLVTRARLAREGDRVRLPEHRPALPPELLAAMDRLETALDVHAPPALAAAAVAAGCPPHGIRALAEAGRIVLVEADLAWAAATYRGLVARALAMAAGGPLTPAEFRDATGTSRKYVLAILEDLDRRGLLRRADAGHVPGPRAPRPAAASGSPTAGSTTAAATTAAAITAAAEPAEHAAAITAAAEPAATEPAAAEPTAPEVAR